MDITDDTYDIFDLNQSLFNNEDLEEYTMLADFGVFNENQSIFDNENFVEETFDLNKSLSYNGQLSIVDEENTPVTRNENDLPLKQSNCSRGDDNEEYTPNDFLEFREDTTESFSTESIFEDRIKLIEWCRTAGKSIGVVVVTKHSESGNTGRKPRVILACERSGNYRSNHKKSDNDVIGEISSYIPRKTGTKKCDCPFRLKGNYCKESGWRLVVDCGFHNHALGDNLVGHSYVARLTPEEQKMVICLTLGGVKPREILITLKKTFPGNLSTRTTIYNFRAKHNLLTLEGRSQMQQLFKDMNEHGYLEFHRENTAGECTDIFLAHPRSIMLAKCFPEVLVMDCTYKTNLHKLPLFEIVGFTSTKKTFAIAFVYLESEKEDNYVWALQKLHQVLENKASSVGVMVTDCELALVNAISKVFPKAIHLLCRWHIMTNIQARYKKTFKTAEDWDNCIAMVRDLVHSENFADYERNLMRLKEEYENHHGITAYIEKQWLSRYKDRFISAWTDSILHFDTLTTNRAESMHAALKMYLGSSRGNLTRNWKLIDNFLENQFTEIAHTFNKCRNNLRHCFKGREYAEVRGLISVSALEMLAKEITRSKFVGMNKKLCGCVVKRTCGIPCAHEINEYVILPESCIPLSKIHPRWQKLDSIPVEHPRGPLDITPHLESIKEKFNSEPDYMKVLMLKKCREIADPKTTALREPRTKTNVRGRPRQSKNCASPAKKEYDTKRKLSAFEYAKTQEEIQADQASKHNRSKKPKESQKAKKPRGKQINDKFMLKDYDDDYIPKWPELNEFSPLVQNLIASWEDVPGDGHCGFRSIAKLLGYNDHDGWSIVRSLLLEEMMSHYHEYVLLFNVQRFQYLKSNLECRLPETYVKDNWFTTPDMGWMVANAFNCVFVCIETDMDSISFFPMRTAPNPKEIKIVAIAHINKRSHYVPVVLVDNAPIPPLMFGWDRYRRLTAAPWRSLLQPKLDDWLRRTSARNILADTRNEVKVMVDLSKDEEMVEANGQALIHRGITPKNQGLVNHTLYGERALENQTIKEFYGLGQGLVNQAPYGSIMETTSNIHKKVESVAEGLTNQSIYNQNQGPRIQPFHSHFGVQSLNTIFDDDFSRGQQGNFVGFKMAYTQFNLDLDLNKDPPFYE